MNISYLWLKEYLNLSLSPEELTDKLTFSGIEVEAINKTNILLENIVVAEIIDKSAHPQADKLSICQVNDGKEVHQVVCGAPNCAQGQKIAFAPIGTEFPEFKIKKAKLRGIESYGMICSEKELCISDNHSGIMVLPDNAPIGLTLSQYLNNADTVYEVEITPNRPDLLGMLGVARDLSAQLGIKINLEEVKPLKTVEELNNLKVINQEPDFCLRYMAVKINNVKVKPSPDWLVQKLVAADIKPINNIVDITNYVMYEYGHPLHAFDADKVNGNQIIIRKSVKGEKFPALDHQTYTLTGEELMIADKQKAIALAGVIGGENSHITDSTKNIILEAACFNPTITRRTSHNLKIFTDSSYRFERGMSPKTCEEIAAKATKLIIELADAESVNTAIDIYPVKEEIRVIKLRPTRIKKLLSLDLDNNTVISYLKNLGLNFIGTEKETLLFEVPHYRIDLVREIDLIEEIIRLHGFDKVEINKPADEIMNKNTFYAKRSIKNILVNKGFYEALNLSFTDPSYLDTLDLAEDDYRRNTVNIINPQGASFSILRSTLIPGLLKNILQNINNGTEDVKLFELNKVFTRKNQKLSTEIWRLTGVVTGKFSPVFWKEKALPVNYFDIKGIILSILNYHKIYKTEIVKSSEPYYLPETGFDIKYKSNILGNFGKLDKKILQKFDIDKDVYLFDLNLNEIFANADFEYTQYQEVQKFPIVYRDLSFIISNEFLYKDIADTVIAVNPKLIHNVTGFDEFTGKQIKEGFRSLSISLSIFSLTKTLTDEQIKSIMDNVINKLYEKYKIEMR
ncbi:MAG: phenylalanine--tRNA ligase subunit beta [Candidatus Cloacimonetes bacterium]|nr:phenylalanine--tRNA ligase subunit beta [Candidatus Cloacimonadota bacterium]